MSFMNLNSYEDFLEKERSAKKLKDNEEFSIFCAIIVTIMVILTFLKKGEN